MTCASCAAAIAKTLDKMDGVTASVNFATDGAKATHDPSVHPGDLVATVEATGYRATLPIPATADPLDAGEVPDDREREAAAWWQRLVISAVLTAPVLAMSMVPAWRVDNWQWLSLTLASPVVVWGRCRSTAPRGRTCGTVPRRWTP